MKHFLKELCKTVIQTAATTAATTATSVGVDHVVRKSLNIEPPGVIEQAPADRPKISQRRRRTM